MADEQKIHLAVIALLCVVPAIATIAAVLHASMRNRRTPSRARGFPVIVKRANRGTGR
ncbi:MAG TPA: hypothetical protein VH370_18705 [Humisphaera sp.]|jgi:hypothetical protein|nr:hypothetical protein [Humisphaera sp.]